MDYDTVVCAPYKIKHMDQLQVVQRRAPRIPPGMKNLSDEDTTISNSNSNSKCLYCILFTHIWYKHKYYNISVNSIEINLYIPKQQENRKKIVVCLFPAQSYTHYKN